MTETADEDEAASAWQRATGAEPDSTPQGDDTSIAEEIHHSGVAQDVVDKDAITPSDDRAGGQTDASTGGGDRCGDVCSGECHTNFVD